MIRLTVFATDYEHNAVTRQCLVNPQCITHVAFHPEQKYSDGRTMYPPRAQVYLAGFVRGSEGSSSDSASLEVRDPASLQLLQRLDQTPLPLGTVRPGRRE